jgi:oxalate decarboxylase/phosphoglucose isomerase-like protein (cupin superfamily)
MRSKRSLVSGKSPSDFAFHTMDMPPMVRMKAEKYASLIRPRTMDFQAGDVGYVEKNLLHYIENTGKTDLVFLEMLKSSFYQGLSLSDWLSHIPPRLVMAHLNIDRATLDAIPKDKLVVLPE